MNENETRPPGLPESTQTLSVIYLTCNAGADFARSLASIAWANEIIVIDRGSQDETLAWARQYTDLVFFHPSEDPYIQLQFALSKAKCDWVLWLKPEEWVEESLRQEIVEVLEYGKNQCEAYWFQQKIWLQGQGFWSCEPQALRMIRRFKETLQDAGPWSSLAVTGSSRPFKTPLMIAPGGENEALFEMAYRQGSSQAYRALELGARRPHVLSSLSAIGQAFFYRYFMLQGFQKGFHGLLIAVMEAYKAFWACAKHHALWQGSKP